MPPEKNAAVYELAKQVLGTGILLNSDGGSGGDGEHDEGISSSPYAKTARQISQESHPVVHGGVDHGSHQYSRFSVIDVEGKSGYENVPRSTTTGRRRIRATISINGVANFWKELKRYLPNSLTYENYMAK